MPSPDAVPAALDAAKAALLDGLGTLTEEEAAHLRDGLDAGFVRREIRALEGQRLWLWALGAVMVVLAVALPTGMLLRFILEADRNITVGELWLRVAAWSTYAGAQTALPVYLYRRWHHRLTTYRALAALARAPRLPAPNADEASDANADALDAADRPDETAVTRT
jgi:hypothetical protein